MLMQGGWASLTSQVTAPQLPGMLAISPVPGFWKHPHISAIMVTGVLLCVCIHASASFLTPVLLD